MFTGLLPFVLSAETVSVAAGIADRHIEASVLLIPLVGAVRDPIFQVDRFEGE